MKAILVIDVPVLDDGRHLCNECPIWDREKCFCEYDFNMKAKGCPLKPMPQKKTYEEPTCLEEYKVSQMLVMANADGWNACLEEIVDGND